MEGNSFNSFENNMPVTSRAERMLDIIRISKSHKISSPVRLSYSNEDDIGSDTSGETISSSHLSTAESDGPPMNCESSDGVVASDKDSASGEKARDDLLTTDKSPNKNEYCESNDYKPRKNRSKGIHEPNVNGKNVDNKFKSKTKKRRPSKPEYFRADQIWDRKTNAFKLKKTAVRSEKDEYGQYVFHVRRCFDARGELQQTVVDVKSQILKKLLEIVMGKCKDVSFAEAEPEIDPNMIFLYLEDIRAFHDKIKAEAELEVEEKQQKKLFEYAALLACVLEYMDKDYERLKARLRALLEVGEITFDLLWTLFRSEDIAYLPTYSTPEEPRALRINFTYKINSMMQGMRFCIEGEFLNYDGKNFGLSTAVPQIDQFEGTRRITSLPCYPFKYHSTGEAIRKDLIERGKKFLHLVGTNYRSHEGLGFMKRDNKVIKVSVNSRIMIDPLVFRRVDPNYPIPSVKPDGTSSSLKSFEMGCAHESENDFQRYRREMDEKTKSRPCSTLVIDKSQKPRLIDIQLSVDAGQPSSEILAQLLDEGGVIKREFTEEELLISSPVVLGFAFTQKLWLEFTVSGIANIEWNDGAFESLVLPERQKSLIKALVTSHASVGKGRDTVDDVIKGKGKGLVAVLHGTPGVGKTLTAEGIADLLRRPLYYISAGELGTNPRDLETELTKILDVAQTWGAVLLLDEAEVFLEARTAQDIHRNALVSIFLRVLEYFQGILFLTSNRVTCFDAAFQSRIHFALRYHELDFQARRAIFKMFIDRVVDLEGPEEAVKTPAHKKLSIDAPSRTVEHFTDGDLDKLARRNNVNGRQIKNAVRSAQALALAENKPMSVVHVLRVLEVAESFEQDLKGGSGYMDAMRSYT